MTAPTVKMAGREAFFTALFRGLDHRAVRYCVLHSYDDVAHRTEGDVDLAVHPSDMRRLLAVFATLAQAGYPLVQGLNYAVGACYFVFGWMDGTEIRTVEVDVMYEHRRRGLYLGASSELVARRRRCGEIWIPGATDEFAYLLAKKALKGSVPEHQRSRLQCLAAEVGSVQARQVAARLFGESRAPEVVRAIVGGNAASLIPRLGRTLWWTTFRRHPLQCLRGWTGEVARMWRRWLRPSGLFLAVLGPDGAGKSTLIEHLLPQAGGAFRHRHEFHWRPHLLWSRSTPAPPNPHQSSPRGSAGSVAALLCLMLDYWFGYLFVIRPRLVRSGWVIFDRYLDDLLADPSRYRYGGPMGLPRLLRKLSPRPDMVLVLDAPERTIASRKQELTVDEIRDQRKVYRNLADGDGRFVMLNAAASAETVCAQAGQTACDLMAHRFQRRFGFVPLGSSNPVDRVIERSFGAAGAFSLAETQDPLRWMGTPGKRPNKDGDLRQFAVVPSPGAPRWLLPGQSRATAVRSLREIYSPYAWKGIAGKAALEAFVRVGGRRWRQADIFVPRGVEQPLEDLVRECTGERRPVFAVVIGNSPRYPKATIQVMRDSGEVLGYFKLPLTDAAAERVRHEISILRQLAGWSQLRTCVPSVLYADEVSDMPLLFRSPLPGRRGPLRFGSAHETFLRTLRNRSTTIVSSARLVADLSRRWNAVCPVLNAEQQEIGCSVLENLRQDLGDHEVPCCLNHGDFAPWNTRLVDGSLAVFDWESATWGKPLLWDRFHFELQACIELHRPLRVAGLLQEALEEDASAGRSLLLMYLLDSTCSLLTEGGRPGDAHISRRLQMVATIAA